MSDLRGALNSMMHMLVEPVKQSGVVTSQICSESGEVFASMLDVSIGSEPGDWLEQCSQAVRVVVRCGDPVEADAQGDEAARLLASWSQAGWAQFDEQLAQLDQVTQERGVELLIRPSCHGMLSDAICTMSWARRAQGLDCGLLLDPVGWLAESMMRDVDDHLRRIEELCVGCSKIRAVLVRSVRRDSAGKFVESSVAEGLIDPELIAARLAGLIEYAGSVVVLDRADLDLLGL